MNRETDKMFSQDVVTLTFSRNSRAATLLQISWHRGILKAAVKTKTHFEVSGLPCGSSDFT